MAGVRAGGHAGRTSGLVTLAVGLTLLVGTTAPGQVPRPSTPTVVIPAAEPPPTDGERAPGPPPGAGILGGVVRILPLPVRAPQEPRRGIAPGAPPRGARPRPGSIFDPGASGPGISQSGDQNFLDGALDARTGWPFVFLDHFHPRLDRIENFWYVSSRDCPQEMGTDPWADLKIMHFDDRGDMVQRDPAELFAQVVGRPVLIQVQGSLTTPDMAVGGLMWTHSWLQAHHCLPPDVVVIAFDWPSQRVYRNDVLDINEKGRRAFVAAYHLARFIQSFPPSSRVCVLGQSYGGRVVPGALHLLGGGSLNSQSHDPEVCLPTTRPDLDMHGIIIAGASDRDWLDPGKRYDRTLAGVTRFLNLYNRKDESLILYPGLIRSNHHRAIGRIGLTNRDFERLGPLAARYEEHDVHDLLGTEHTLLDAVANPRIGRWIAPYVWAPDPGPIHKQTESSPTPYGTGRNTGSQKRFETSGGERTRGE
ncbi:MAG TPA: hypothetical protein VGH33_27865 [Isosphaeraceae bacterium]